MNKIKVGFIFGGMSTENEISVKSALSVISHVNTEKYEIYKIYINKNGEWKEYFENTDCGLHDENAKCKGIENIVEYLKNLDIAFPILHGRYGEDGTIQGLFELLKLPYIGCGVLASSIGMDKVYTKIIFEKAGLKQAKYEYIKKISGGKNVNNSEEYLYINKNFEEEKNSLDEIAIKVANNLKFPMYVKPSNSGSSIGINKARNISELKENIKIAGEFDNKILIEEGIAGREVECAVLGNEDVIASGIGEILPADEYYSYNAKYNNKNSVVSVPAKNVENDIVEKIRSKAVKAFKAIDGSGLARVDFFIENGTNDIYINEINTLPGFTDISMYPKLFEQFGISYEDLIDKIIMLGLEKNSMRI